MTLIRLKVHAGATRDELQKKGAGLYEVWVRAPAENGRANEAVLALLAAELAQPAKKLRIMKGAASPSKIVGILGS